MNKKQLVVLLVAVFLLCAGITAIIYSEWVIVEVKYVYAEVQIDDTIGLTVDNEALMFGRIVPKGSSKRIIELKNSDTKPLYAQFSVEGNILPLLAYEPLVLLDPSNTTKITISAHARQFTEGNFTGIVRIIIKRTF